MAFWRNTLSHCRRRRRAVYAGALAALLTPLLALQSVALPGHALLGAASAATPASGRTTQQSSGAVPVNPRSDVGATTRILNPGVVSWVHFGDLHITDANEQNYADFKTIIYNTNHYLKNGINFAVLPGDNANDGLASEYQLIKAATDQLQVPLYAVPGDHDHKVDIGLYEKYLEPRLYQSFSAGGYHFIFLDVMAGISSGEQSWLQNDLATAAREGLKSIIFMHSYTVAYQLQSLIQKYNVVMVDAGHTHTNNLANDGHTIYAATRSTGQVTEGPVGFSIVNIDNGVISWKFKPLGGWPFVMITSPADKALMINGSQVVHGTVNIRAKVWDNLGVAAATYHVDNGASHPLYRIGTTQMWSAPFNSTTVSTGTHTITVDVRGAGGNTSQDTINVLVSRASSVQLPQRSFGPFDNFIGAYTEKGLLDTNTGNGGGGPGGRGGPAGRAGKGGPGVPPPAGGPRGKRGHGGPGAPPPPGGPGGPHGRGGVATIVSVNGDRMTVRAANGTTQQVLLSSSTQITKVVSGSRSDLKPGETVTLRVAPSTAPATSSASGSTVTATQVNIDATGSTASSR